MIFSELQVLERVQVAAAPVTQEWETTGKMVRAYSQSGEQLPLHLRSRITLLLPLEKDPNKPKQ